MRHNRCASTSASAPMPVCAWVPLISVSPSFERERGGREAGAAQHVGGRPGPIATRQRAFPDHRERKVRQRRQIAARAHAALLGNGRPKPGVEHAEQQLSKFRSRARIALGNHVGAEQHHRPDLALREQFADSRGMAAHQIHLQLGEAIRRNGDVRQFAESCRHPVRNGAIAHQIFDNAPRHSSTLAGVRSHRHGAPGRELPRRPAPA